MTDSPRLTKRRLRRPGRTVATITGLCTMMAMAALAPAPVGAAEQSRESAVQETVVQADDTGDGNVDGWTVPAATAVREDIASSLEGYDLSDQQRADVEAIWEDADDELVPWQVLRRVLETAVVVEPTLTAVLYESAVVPHTARPTATLESQLASLPKPLADNVRLALAAYCIQHRRYEWALNHLDGLETADVADPAALLFYRSVAQYQLLDREAGMKSLDALLDAPAENVPVRYRIPAEAMRRDLAALEPNSLSHIARRMSDVERRLQLAEADQQLLEIERGIIESLEKLLEKLEEMRKQQQQNQASSGGMQSSQSIQPASESRLLGGRGEGRVTKRDIGSSSGWGDLPPKEREKALQEIGRQFPPHYRKVVEEYFRRLANQPE